jgi:TM2 domain-containing membrane protein YozV
VLTALLLSLFVGVLGIDRFYLGHIALGVLKLITFGGCGIWALIDVILIAVDNVKDSKGLRLRR